MSVAARRRCASPEAAERLRRALAVDSPPFVSLEVDGADLLLRAAGPTARSLRATFEDLVACLQAAERTAGR